MKPLNNKYTKIYNQLIESRIELNRKFTTGCEYEKHHIIPKSLSGDNSKSNLVVLTYREHCIAHMLLVRMYDGSARGKMCYAIIRLFRLRDKNRTMLTSKEYEKLRTEHNKALKDSAHRALRSELTKKQWTPERRAAVAEKARQQWANGPKREIYSSAEYRNKKAQQMKERWQDPGYISTQSQKTSAQWAEGGSLRNRLK